MRVWDPCVRVIHWSVATLVLVELLNEAGANPWHRYLGYAAAALVVARLAWGLGDTGHARLSSMTRNAAGTMKYLKNPGEAHPAHTPPGALMAFVLWMLVLAAAATGWMQGLDSFWGEEWLQDLHEVLAYALAAFAAVHVTAALTTSRVLKVNLVKAMITGDKSAPG